MRNQPIRIVCREDRCFAVLEGGKGLKNRPDRTLAFLVPLLLLLFGVECAQWLHWF